MAKKAEQNPPAHPVPVGKAFLFLGLVFVAGLVFVLFMHHQAMLRLGVGAAATPAPIASAPATAPS